MYANSFKPAPLEGPESDRIIASGKRWKCHDWTCPAARCCKRHFVRSQEYAAMAERRYPLAIPRRNTRMGVKLPTCDQYQRADFDPFWELPARANGNDPHEVLAAVTRYMAHVAMVENGGRPAVSLVQ